MAKSITTISKQMGHWSWGSLKRKQHLTMFLPLQERKRYPRHGIISIMKRNEAMQPFPPAHSTNVTSWLRPSSSMGEEALKPSPGERRAHTRSPSTLWTQLISFPFLDMLLLEMATSSRAKNSLVRIWVLACRPDVCELLLMTSAAFVECWLMVASRPIDVWYVLSRRPRTIPR